MPAARPDLFAILAGESHVALAVSGGSDSIALLRLAQRWTSSTGTRLSVLTVDHGLRASSAAEAMQVAQWTAALGLPHVTLQWQGAKPATGIQARARQARYDLMSDWCRSHGATPLLTAHTLDDQAETVLMRLARTSSLDSLAGIHRASAWKGIAIFRPLLDARRADLRRLLDEAGQAWIEDPSNDDDRFERVRIRKSLPLLAQLGIAPEALAHLADEAHGAATALNQTARQWIARHVTGFETGHCRFDPASLAEAGAAIGPRVMGLLVARYGAGKCPEPAALDLLMGWLAQGGASRRTLGGAVIARRSRDILIGREAGRIDADPVVVPASGEVLWDGRFEVKAPPGSVVRPALVAGKLARCRELPAFVQASLPAVTGKAGDTILPPLMPGHAASARFCGRPNV